MLKYRSIIGLAARVLAAIIVSVVQFGAPFATQAEGVESTVASQQVLTANSAASSSSVPGTPVITPEPSMAPTAEPSIATQNTDTIPTKPDETPTASPIAT